MASQRTRLEPHRILHIEKVVDLRERTGARCCAKVASWRTRNVDQSLRRRRRCNEHDTKAKKVGL